MHYSQMAGEPEAVKKKGWLACKREGFFAAEVSPVATMTPRQPDRMGREPQPPRTKKWSLRNDEGRQGEGTPARLWTKLNSRSEAEATNK